MILKLQNIAFWQYLCLTTVSVKTSYVLSLTSLGKVLFYFNTDALCVF